MGWVKKIDPHPYTIWWMLIWTGCRCATCGKLCMLRNADLCW